MQRLVRAESRRCVRFEQDTPIDALTSLAQAAL
jgi:hypothetical protein